MSSLRNAVKRITHKERPTPRSHGGGFLERKKDYVVRAKDFHRKEDRINAMREKAAMKNPDEFYFGMKNSLLRDGKHRKTQQAERRKFEEEVGMDTVRIMKDQDLSYVRMQKQKDSKKIEKLQSSLHFIGVPSKKRKHTVFVESQDQAEKFDAAEHFQTLPELVDRTHNRPRIVTLKKVAIESSMAYDSSKNGKQVINNNNKPTKEELILQSRQARQVAKKLAKQKELSYKEMRAREKRVAAMKRAEAHLVTEKLVAAKGRKRKIKEAENGKPAQYKWRRKRLG